MTREAIDLARDPCPECGGPLVEGTYRSSMGSRYGPYPGRCWRCHACPIMITIQRLETGEDAAVYLLPTLPAQPLPQAEGQLALW